jgi:hypothetical protein
MDEELRLAILRSQQTFLLESGIGGNGGVGEKEEGEGEGDEDLRLAIELSRQEAFKQRTASDCNSKIISFIEDSEEENEERKGEGKIEDQEDEQLKMALRFSLEQRKIAEEVKEKVVIIEEEEGEGEVKDAQLKEAIRISLEVSPSSSSSSSFSSQPPTNSSSFRGNTNQIKRKNDGSRFYLNRIKTVEGQDDSCVSFAEVFPRVSNFFLPPSSCFLSSSYASSFLSFKFFPPC